MRVATRWQALMSYDSSAAYAKSKGLGSLRPNLATAVSGYVPRWLHGWRERQAQGLAPRSVRIQRDCPSFSKGAIPPFPPSPLLITSAHVAQ